MSIRTSVRVVTAGITQRVIVEGPNEKTNVRYIKYQCDRNIGGVVYEAYEATAWDEEQLAKEPVLRKTASFPSWYEMTVPYRWDYKTGLSQ